MKPVIFLDSGGVINDNVARAPQWRRHVADFFAPRLGGTRAAWEDANRATVEQLMAADALEARYRRATGFSDFERDYNLDWLLLMCALVGVQAPEDDEAVALAVQASREIVRKVHAPLPGAVNAIRALHRAGFSLHTASGELSEDLDAIFTALEVRHCFGRLFGPDLIDTLKRGPEFYGKVFAAVGVPASDAMVVDDSPMVLAWAAELGAQTVLVKEAPPPGWAAASIRSLSELPELLA